ncbi:hypothetical protein [uncultured Thiodictyon sp.]|uniref:hypothetical protein n=1 Tax=uncultured Thiodictyon sp. TaxID=1846217 RepID=UPI0025E79417|nr:hypothetical protein [uncultured Thiodictyon sp.]
MDRRSAVHRTLFRVVVVVVIGESRQLGVRGNPGRYDNLDYDNDNDRDAEGIP